MSEAPKPRLTVVEPSAPTLAERIAALQAELRAANAEQVNGLRYALETAVIMAREVDANPSQHPGLQEIARQVAEQGDSMLQTLIAISGRVG